MLGHDHQPLAAQADGHVVRQAGAGLPHVPVVAVAQAGPGVHARLNGLHNPMPGYQRPAQPFALLQHQLADAGQVPRPQAQAGGGGRLAVGARRPLGLVDAQRSKQLVPRIVQQRHAAALRAQMAQQGRRPAAVAPAFAGRGDDGLLQHVAVAVAAALHGDFAVARVGVRKVLVPLQAHGHAQGMGDEDGAPALIGRQIAVGGKGLDQGSVQRGHLAFGQGQAVQQADDALADRAHIVQGVGVEGHLAQRLAPAFVLALEIALQRQPAVAHHDDGVQVRQFSALHALVQAFAQVFGQAGAGAGAGGRGTALPHAGTGRAAQRRQGCARLQPSAPVGAKAVVCHVPLPCFAS